MENLCKKALRDNIAASFQFCVARSCAQKIADLILNDVADEIDGLGKDDYTSEDVKQSVGRVLYKRLENS